ncbi:hypothetical protein [Puniceibacterium antarcticum]|uniref:hypothetical protein n=1 Tax=Puniceibacterium antarcticum TaxID=1206336 RepID=UPI00117B49C3|nr:hypothetical protein [Puniceibacterium antarcticum]
MTAVPVAMENSIRVPKSDTSQVFAPGQPERLGLIQKASMMLVGTGSAAIAAPVATAAALPLFCVTE